jgi:hypothetical protein
MTSKMQASGCAVVPMHATGSIPGWIYIWPTHLSQPLHANSININMTTLACVSSCCFTSLVLGCLFTQGDAFNVISTSLWLLHSARNCDQDEGQHRQSWENYRESISGGFGNPKDNHVRPCIRVEPFEAQWVEVGTPQGRESSESWNEGMIMWNCVHRRQWVGGQGGETSSCRWGALMQVYIMLLHSCLCPNIEKIVFNAPQNAKFT